MQLFSLKIMLRPVAGPGSHSGISCSDHVRSLIQIMKLCETVSLSDSEVYTVSSNSIISLYWCLSNSAALAAYALHALHMCT